MAYSCKDKPDFERPPVSEWMSRPKSSDLPVWGTQHQQPPSESTQKYHEKPHKDFVRASKLPPNLHLELDEASSGWTTPPTSRRGQSSTKTRRNLNDEHFSLQLSPSVKVTLHSPKGLATVVTSKKGEVKRKFSLKIRSRRKHGRDRTSSSESSADGASSRNALSTSSHREVKSSVPSVLLDSERPFNHSMEDNPSVRTSERSNPDDREIDAFVSSSMPGPQECRPTFPVPRAAVRKVAVMKEFVPPPLAAKDGKDAQLSGRRTVTRVELPEFKPPYTFSPPQKLSPEKETGLQSERSVRTAQEQQEAAAGSPDKMTQSLKNLLDTLNESKTKTAKAPGKSEYFVLNNGAVEVQECGTSRQTPRKRVIDVEAAQNYIREQKKKRQKMTQAEKARKKIEMEERKKKLADLRVRSLQLAAACKRKRSPKKVASYETKYVEKEEDLTLSLGLRQVKPKRSFQQSLASLGTTRNVVLPEKNDEPAKPDEDHEEREEVEVKKPREGNGLEDYVPGNIRSIYREENYVQLRQLADRLTVPKVQPSVTVQTKESDSDINSTLLKIAQALQSRIEIKQKHSGRHKKGHDVEVKRMVKQKQEKRLIRMPDESKKSARDSFSGSESSESQKLITVDASTIACLKHEIREIAQGFQVLQATMAQRPQDVPTKLKSSDRIPEWLLTIQPRPHPYNVMTAVKNKLRADQHKTPREQEKVFETRMEERREKMMESPYVSDFEPLSSSVQQPLTPATLSGRQISSPSKRDSGSDLPSSILDSDKFLSAESQDPPLDLPPSAKSDRPSRQSEPKITSSKSSDIPESIPTSASEVVSQCTLSSYRENIILMPPEASPADNNPPEPRLNNVFGSTQEHVKFLNTDRVVMNKSDSTISTQVFDNNLSGGSDRDDKQLKKTNQVGSLTRPDPFQALLDSEFNILDNLQKNLARFVEAERQKTSSEKQKREKSVNTEPLKTTEDQAVQTSFAERPVRSETESVRTDIDQNFGEDDDVSIKTDVAEESNRESHASGTEIQESIHDSSPKQKSDESVPSVEMSDSLQEPSGSRSKSGSESTAGISLQMLNRMMKDEQMRAEHQMALIQLRQDALVQKTKAYLAMLEDQKRALRDKGGARVEILISAIKKKQRGILLKYQNERQEIDRLKRMNQIASEDRKIMIKQQKQIQKMQLSTKDMILKFNKKKLETSRKKPIVHSDISEDIASNNSSIPTFIQHSNVSDGELSVQATLSEGEDEILKRNRKILQERIQHDAEKLNKCKKFLGEKEEKLQQQKNSVEEILEWKRRLEVEESRLKELKKRALSVGRGRSPSPLNSYKVDVDAQSDGVSSQPQIPTEVQSDGGYNVSRSIPEAISGGSVVEEVPEEISGAGSTARSGYTTEGKEVSTARSGYTDESFESSSEVLKSSPRAAGGGRMTLTIPPMVKSVLSPRLGTRRRHSSGSDDSANLSHTETTSEPSDVECRLKALKEQLKRRKMEADRLRREQKRKHRERLKEKEESLVKQIEAYDAYIEKLKQEVEQENKVSAPVIRPVIKHPKAERRQKKKEVVAVEEKVSESIGEELDEEKRDESVASISEEVCEEKNQVDSSRAGEDGDETIDSDLSRRSLEEYQQSVSEEVADTQHVEEESFEIKEKTDEISEKVDESPSESEGVESASVKTTIASPGKGENESSEVTTQLDDPAKSFGSPGSPASTAKSLESPESLVLTGEPVNAPSHEKASESASIAEEKISTSYEEVDEQTPSPEEVEDISPADETSEKKESLNEVDVEKDSYAADSFESFSGAEDEKPEKESVEESIEEVAVSLVESKIDSEPEPEQDNEKIDSITEALLAELVDDCVRDVTWLVGKQKDRKVDRLTDCLSRQVIKESLDQVLDIYGKKVRRAADLREPQQEEEEDEEEERVTWDVRRRIHEIMGAQLPPSPARQQGRVQTMLQTTYDVSPATTPPKHDERADGPTEHQEFIISLKPKVRRSTDPQVQVARDVPDSDAQEWFDEDFGLTKTRREAEALRLQQLQIEQEIEQLQAQQEQVPYFYLREIPNKPPPPYTPPGKAATPPAPPPPTSEAEISRNVRSFARAAYRAQHGGKSDPTSPPAQDSFRRFLSDLAKELVAEACAKPPSEDTVVPWERVPAPLAAWRAALRAASEDAVVDAVEHQTLMLFGLRPRVAQESLIVRWSRKKRDHVDELLVWESQAEEAEWTRFDTESVQVKNELTQSLMDSLLQDTASVMDAILKKKAALSSL